MKKIEAIIRRSRFEDVKEALLAADIEWFSYYDVRGVGKTREGRIYRGIVYDTSSIERILLSIVVRDKNVEKTVQAVMQAARTGEIGDGRIFILPVDDSIRIRTGERGKKNYGYNDSPGHGQHSVDDRVDHIGIIDDNPRHRPFLRRAGETEERAERPDAMPAHRGRGEHRVGGFRLQPGVRHGADGERQPVGLARGRL